MFLNGTFRGDFAFKTMLSHSDQFAIARRQKELLGNNKLEDLPVILKQKSIILSELYARIVQAPAWWGDGAELVDDNVLVTVFEAAIDAENEQMKKLLGDGEKAKEDLQKIVDNANRTDVPEPTPQKGAPTTQAVTGKGY